MDDFEFIVRQLQQIADEAMMCFMDDQDENDDDERLKLGRLLSFMDQAVVMYTLEVARKTHFLPLIEYSQVDSLAQLVSIWPSWSSQGHVSSTLGTFELYCKL